MSFYTITKQELSSLPRHNVHGRAEEMVPAEKQVDLRFYELLRMNTAWKQNKSVYTVARQLFKHMKDAILTQYHEVYSLLGVTSSKEESCMLMSDLLPFYEKQAKYMAIAANDIVPEIKRLFQKEEKKQQAVFSIPHIFSFAQSGLSTVTHLNLLAKDHRPLELKSLDKLIELVKDVILRLNVLKNEAFVYGIALASDPLRVGDDFQQKHSASIVEWASSLQAVQLSPEEFKRQALDKLKNLLAAQIDPQRNSAVDVALKVLYQYDRETYLKDLKAHSEKEMRVVLEKAVEKHGIKHKIHLAVVSKREAAAAAVSKLTPEQRAEHAALLEQTRQKQKEEKEAEREQKEMEAACRAEQEQKLHDLNQTLTKQKKLHSKKSGKKNNTTSHRNYYQDLDEVQEGDRAPTEAAEEKHAQQQQKQEEEDDEPVFIKTVTLTPLVREKEQDASIVIRKHIRKRTIRKPKTNAISLVEFQNPHSSTANLVE